MPEPDVLRTQPGNLSGRIDNPQPARPVNLSYFFLTPQSELPAIGQGVTAGPLLHSYEHITARLQSRGKRYKNRMHGRSGLMNQRPHQNQSIKYQAAEIEITEIALYNRTPCMLSSQVRQTGRLLKPGNLKSPFCKPKQISA
nr:hypothetical protein [Desulfogranum marinum]